MQQFYAAPDVSIRAVNRFFEKRNQNRENLQAIQVYVGDALKLRFAPAPYSCTQPKEVNSLSKTFTAAAIGVLYDRGLLRTDERLVDLFPDKLPKDVGENLEKMQIFHLLTMTTGHAACTMHAMYASDDAARAFLAQPVQYEPGTHFLYNTGASCMLAEIVQLKTGRTLFDFLCQTVLEPLEIESAYWCVCAEGVNEGGCGLHICNDDIIKFGRMLLAGGVFDGKRILSEDWCRMLGAAQVDNTENGDSGTGNWTSGYGFQTWRTKRGGYRGDGASGQLCMVMPEHNAVVAVNARTYEMESEIEDVVDLVEHLTDPDPLEPITVRDYPALPVGDLPTFCKDTRVKLEPNRCGFTELHLKKTDDAVVLTLLDGACKRKIVAGLEQWRESQYYALGRTPKLLGLQSPYNVERVHVASCASGKDGVLTVHMRHLASPYSETATVTLENGVLTAVFDSPENLTAPDCAVLRGEVL